MISCSSYVHFIGLFLGLFCGLFLGLSSIFGLFWTLVGLCGLLLDDRSIIPELVVTVDPESQC